MPFMIVQALLCVVVVTDKVVQALCVVVSRTRWSHVLQSFGLVVTDMYCVSCGLVSSCVTYYVVLFVLCRHVSHVMQSCSLVALCRHVVMCHGMQFCCLVVLCVSWFCGVVYTTCQRHVLCVLLSIYVFIQQRHSLIKVILLSFAQNKIVSSLLRTKLSNKTHSSLLLTKSSNNFQILVTKKPKTHSIFYHIYGIFFF